MRSFHHAESIIGMRFKPAALLSLLLLSACDSGEPAHYYVLCQGTDFRGWKLISVYRDDQGYILSCTYQSPDKEQTYTVSCRSDGCD